MKVTSINPGGTFQREGKWAFYYFINADKREVFYPLHKSSNAAKQAMRELVYNLRRKHGLHL